MLPLPLPHHWLPQCIPERLSERFDDAPIEHQEGRKRNYVKHESRRQKGISKIVGRRLGEGAMMQFGHGGGGGGCGGGEVRES